MSYKHPILFYASIVFVIIAIKGTGMHLRLSKTAKTILRLFGTTIVTYTRHKYLVVFLWAMHYPDSIDHHILYFLPSFLSTRQFFNWTGLHLNGILIDILGCHPTTFVYPSSSGCSSVPLWFSILRAIIFFLRMVNEII